MLATFFKKIKTNLSFRIKFFLSLSLVFNISYAVFLFVINQIYSSKWFFVMSVYYALLSITRFFVFAKLKVEKTIRAQIKTLRSCGYFLFLLNVVVSVMMFCLIHETPYLKHHEITVITLATYTFYTLTVAIISGIKCFKKNYHLYACIKVINLISASVSIVTLTNTMLITFGEENILLRSIILPILSAFVAVFIIVTAILMICKANSDLRMLKNEEE